jgi:hypothetical protein
MRGEGAARDERAIDLVAARAASGLRRFDRPGDLAEQRCQVDGQHSLPRIEQRLHLVRHPREQLGSIGRVGLEDERVAQIEEDSAYRHGYPIVPNRGRACRSGRMLDSLRNAASDG